MVLAAFVRLGSFVMLAKVAGDGGFQVGDGFEDAALEAPASFAFIMVSPFSARRSRE
jgi:hypothetical protein